jgi:hypothetical protein
MIEKKMKVILLKPRLDVTFGKGEVPAKISPLQPIRKYWRDFIDQTSEIYTKKKYQVEVIEKPLWQFTVEFVDGLDANIIYIPHHDKMTFPCKSKNKKFYYYMQMVFPWLFQVDEIGWCAGASVWPIKPIKKYEKRIFNKLQKHNKSGKSKFPQPPIKNYSFGKDFIFFPCQIPHDRTITLHSQVTVEQALLKTIEISKKLNIPLLVKPHPANLNSMLPLLDIVKKNIKENVYWIHEMNINELLNSALAVFTVNSGVGMEAILHNKPVYTFGRAEYASVAHFLDSTNINWIERDKYIKDYPAFMHAYISNMVEVPGRY